MKPRKKLRSDIAWSTTDRIGVMGYDLCRDLIGKVSLGDMGFLEVTGRLPNPRESRMFNALLVTLVEHGIVPSTLAARMTHAGAPEAMQLVLEKQPEVIRQKLPEAFNQQIGNLHFEHEVFRGLEVGI